MSKSRNPFAAWIPAATFHAWVMALFYPAVLGTALMAWLSPETPQTSPRSETHWAPVLIAYFALQYGEGLGRQRTYDRRALMADVAEILAILVAFDLMNILQIGFVDFVPGLTLRWVLAAVFLIPVLNRASRWFVPGPVSPEGRWRPRALVAMSCLAAGLALRHVARG